MAKKEKVVDLKQKAEKVTEKQLTQIQSIVDRINNAQMNIGQLEARKHQLLHMIAGTNDELALMQENLHRRIWAGREIGNLRLQSESGAWIEAQKFNKIYELV